MHRQTDYPYQVPSEVDFLYAQRFMYEGLGLALMDVLGVTALVAGLACTATGPASLNVNIGPGRIYSLQNLEPTAWGVLAGVGGLPVDTNADHNILKQGLFRDTTAFTCAAPGTTGQSINYLIEASFSEVDAVPLSLPFVSATPPYPPIAPATLNTVRKDSCVITVKAGIAATTGSQTTPSVDANNVGLWVVTVANGQTTITSGNIVAYSPSSFISETLTQKISQATGDARYAQIAPFVNSPTAGSVKIPGTPFYLKWKSFTATQPNTASDLFTGGYSSSDAFTWNSPFPNACFWAGASYTLVSNQNCTFGLVDAIGGSAGGTLKTTSGQNLHPIPVVVFGFGW